MPKLPACPPSSVSSLEQLRLAKLSQLRDLQVLRDRRAAALYQDDPATWVATYIDLGDGLADYQQQAMTTLAQRRRVALRSPHGAGKTTTAALLVIWFALTREQLGRSWKVITTASAWRQLTLYLWPEIHHWATRIRWDLLGRGPFHPRRELTGLQLRGRHGLAAAVASDDPAMIEGAHAEEVLFVFDEAKTIPAGIWDAAEGALMTGNAYALAVSTPGAPAGRFYDIHARRPGYSDWTVAHITLEQAVAAGRIPAGSAKARASQWGETSSIYANRVLGEFHAGDEDAVIPLAWAEAAVERWHAWDEAGRPDPGGLRLVGVDVARSGADKTVLAHRYGVVVVKLDYAVRQDTMATTARVQAELAAEARLAVVDTTGIGAGVTDRLRELNQPVHAYVGAAKTTALDRSGTWGFTNVRSAAYWRVRELLDPAFGPELCLPPDEQLLADLCAPTWSEKTGIPPKIQVEPKEDLVARLGRSPDAGDAVVMAVWARPPAPADVSAVATFAGAGSLRAPRMATSVFGQRSGFGNMMGGPR